MAAKSAFILTFLALCACTRAPDPTVSLAHPSISSDVIGTIDAQDATNNLAHLILLHAQEQRQHILEIVHDYLADHNTRDLPPGPIGVSRAKERAIDRAQGQGTVLNINTGPWDRYFSRSLTCDETNNYVIAKRTISSGVRYALLCGTTVMSADLVHDAMHVQ